MTHITLTFFSLYVHRGVAHKALIFHPAMEHFIRFWLWLTDGTQVKEWIAMHRKHHRYTDKSGDPHSPVVFGIKNIMFRGVYYYYLAAKDAQMIVSYGKGTPNDWIERNLYTRHSRLGILLMLVVDLLLFGPWGLLVWGIQMLWIPFWAAGVVNGVAHWWGYKNGTTKDNSRNISPVGIIIGGEELHNNHHLEPGNPKLSRRWFEFDIGWFWFKIFNFLHLAKLRT
jgi:stearoyl-CoA desaturase (delta-9 desaturase)